MACRPLSSLPDSMTWSHSVLMLMMAYDNTRLHVVPFAVVSSSLMSAAAAAVVAVDVDPSHFPSCVESGDSSVPMMASIAFAHLYCVVYVWFYNFN